MCSRKWEEGHGVRAKHGLMSDDFLSLCLCCCHLCLQTQRNQCQAFSRFAAQNVLSLRLYTHTGGPPGVELVQCEITWVIRIFA